MEVSFGRKNAALVVKISGEIDHHSLEYIREKTDREYIKKRLNDIEIDLSEVTFADSSVIGFIMGRMKAAKGFGGSCSVYGAKGVCGKIIKMSGLDRVISVKYEGDK